VSNPPCSYSQEKLGQTETRADVRSVAFSRVAAGAGSAVDMRTVHMDNASILLDHGVRFLPCPSSALSFSVCHYSLFKAFSLMP
jgi:hypothetical protein